MKLVTILPKYSTIKLQEPVFKRSHNTTKHLSGTDFQRLSILLPVSELHSQFSTLTKSLQIVDMTGVYEVMSSLEEVNGNNHSQSLLVQERDGRWHFKTRGRRFSSTWHLSKFWNFLTMDIVDTRKSLQDIQKESSEQGVSLAWDFCESLVPWTVSCAKVFSHRTHIPVLRVELQAHTTFPV